MPYLVVRVTRRIREFLAVLQVHIKSLPKRATFFFSSLKYRREIAYIWEAFIFLAGIEMKDVMYTQDEKFSLFGAGFFVDIEEFGESASTIVREWPRVRKLCITQYGKRLVIQEWRPEERIVLMEYGAKVKTHWFDTLRTGHSLDPEGIKSAVELLRRFYGDGVHTQTGQLKAAGGSDV